MRRAVFISFLLALVTVAAYWPIRQAKFLHFDDPQYVTNNPKVFHGLSARGLAWAFTSFHASNWHPVTWVSHMLDCQIFGDNPTGHHFVNLGLHIANAVLLFLLLWRMTGAQMRSGFVAALFALHPLHVESVAWISERKDVLSTCFGLMTLWFYLRYVRGTQGQHRAGKLNYVMSLALFCLGLMSKPMLVPLPFVMLLLDYWPLGRLSSPAQHQQKPVMPLLREKMPFFLLSAGSGVITFLAQEHGGAVVKTDIIPIEMRLLNTCVSYAWYLGKCFWPVDLAPFYPYPKTLTLESALAAGLVILAVAIAVVWLARRAPYLLVGWFWFLITLVPVIGLIQVGSQSRADRYTYVPIVGLFIMVTWGVSNLMSRWRYGQAALVGAGASILAASALATHFQVQYWRNGVTAFERAVTVSPDDNALGYHNLGTALSMQGNQREAIARFQQSLRLRQDYPEAYYSIGNALGVQGRLDEAVANYRHAIQLRPDYEEAHYSQGKALALQGRWSEAEASFRNALRCKADSGDAMTRLGNVMLMQGNDEPGMSCLFAAIRLDPENAESHYYLAAALAQRRRYAEAVMHFRKAMAYQPNYVGAMNDLAWILATESDATIRNLPEAVKLAGDACRLSRNRNPLYQDTLAVALSEAGEFREAVAVAERAVRLAEQTGRFELLSQLNAHLEAFRQGRKYREAFPKDF